MYFNLNPNTFEGSHVVKIKELRAARLVENLTCEENEPVLSKTVYMIDSIVHIAYLEAHSRLIIVHKCECWSKCMVCL